MNSRILFAPSRGGGPATPILPVPVRKAAHQAIGGMRCDYSMTLIACQTPPEVSPRLYVPSKTQSAPGHGSLKLTTPIHYCHAHVGTMKVEDLLTDRVKADFEDAARKVRPIDFKCDFDNAFLHYVSIFTPEYQAYIAMIEGKLQNFDFGGVPFGR